MGKVFINVSSDKLDIAKALEFCRSEFCGAEILFLGTVRNTNENRPVKAVNYDGHTVLGRNVLQEICSEVQDKWGQELSLYVEHRLGLLCVGEVSLIIQVTSPHRDSAYLSSRYIIEQIKMRLPIWKEEIYVDGESKWLKGQSLTL